LTCASFFLKKLTICEISVFSAVAATGSVLMIYCPDLDFGRVFCDSFLAIEQYWRENCVIKVK
jgi:hypothetical protein